MRPALTLCVALLGASAQAQAPPRVTAASAVVIDEETGAVLWAKAADTLREPASTTKVMTALLFVEAVPSWTIVRAPKDVAGAGGSSIRLKAGEEMKAEDLLAALMVRSANDAARTIAVRVSGSERAFATLMNERAALLGATRTTFRNPHGMPQPGHRTTARDLARIGRAALKYPAVLEVGQLRSRRLERSMRLQGTWVNRYNPFMDADPSAVGLKTGLTRGAGQCFVGGVRRQGFGIVTVVLKSRDWVGDTQRLVEWAYASHSRVRVAQRGVPLTRATVPGGSDPLDLLATRDVWIPVRNGQVPPSWTLPAVPSPPIARLASLGRATMTLADGTTVLLDVTAGQGIENKGAER